MSAHELRAHIAKLDTEIDLQRELLKKLERDRSLTQRRLNSILDPLALLPLEISSEIFLQTLAPFPEPGILHAPMLLLSICNAWTDIALATPALWNTIQIVFPCARDLKKILPIWLERAQHRSLSVSLRKHGPPPGLPFREASPITRLSRLVLLPTGICSLTMCPPNQF
ncbi:hypothetical protein B0H14DRAFT_765179 [Mycena olivaceomarginata]|nr:hypothetical protein B0H14DRAFT_765179 [Mycena olivaceomarginata]